MASRQSSRLTGWYVSITRCRGVSGDGFDWAEKRRELRALAGGEQAALNGAGIQFAAIGKAGGGFQPELPAGKVVVVGPVVGDIGDDPALNGVIARQPAEALSQEMSFGPPQGTSGLSGSRLR
ncbi:hypothetical protein ECZU06_50230 [Escherichia coli]|nr:hypothetical protein ECZU06_50230 [Escherichia coli]GHK84406.1 hypothetical protein ECZU17_03430 [Escherichia coli]GHL27161.1 hypothetical protein ECZU25_39740 [Escherichia coli]